MPAQEGNMGRILSAKSPFVTFVLVALAGLAFALLWAFGLVALVVVFFAIVHLR